MREDNDNKWWQPALIFYGKITGWIIAPLAVAYFLGHSLVLILGAFVLTIYGIYREIKIYKMTLTQGTDIETKDGDK